MVKVVVVRGRQLVIRDFRTSDPYVVLHVANQTAKTKVINSCLNPVWNEELTFSITEPIEELKLEVFDKDRFKADDKMGNAHVSLQPIATAARLKQVVKVSRGETRMRTVVPDSDNCLVRDSYITCIDGEVVQDVWLRLFGVESGEIELKLKWVDALPR